MRGAIFTLFDFIAGKGDLITVVLSFFSVFVIIFLCFPFHECAHAFVAHLLGDDTASEQGRLTLNPLVHIDPMGALCMCLCNIGWARPTPVDIRRCRKVSARTADVLVSVAGPVSNIILALILMIISKVLLVTIAPSTTLIYVVMALQMTANINAFLAVFNLLPIPPFDGYALIQGVLPRKASIWVEQHAQIINLIVLVLMIAGALSGPLNFLSDKIMWVLDKATSFIH